MERRLAAILAADVVGYSRLMGADEAGTLAALKALRAEALDPAIARHKGRIVKLMGDGTLVEFASVVGAVECAAAIQRAVAGRNAEIPDDKRIQFRIGINLGDVIIDGDDIYGDGVNVAARLEGLAEPGGVCVSGAVFEQVKGKLDLGFQDMGAQEVKNIAEPVRAYRVVLEGPSVFDTPPPLPDKPSIAVLPLANMSGDPEQDYFADGITEDVITALSHVRWLFVIARNSSFAYKGQSPDIRRVARELGVRYVLEGSVRKAGSRIRLTAQLIDGATGSHIWAERYDRELEDIFDLQDELTLTIAGAIEPALGQAERERTKSKRPDSLDAWDLCQQGLFRLYKYTKDDLGHAQHLFRETIELDPGLGLAHSGLAETYYYFVVLGHADSPMQCREEAIGPARKAVELDREDATAHCALGRIHTLQRQPEAAIPEFETALRLNPSLALAHYGLGAVLAFSGKPEQSIPHLERAIRLSPFDPNMGSFLVRMAQAQLCMRHYEEAADWARKALRQPHFQYSRFAILASALGHLGRREEAKQVVDELLRLMPNFTLDVFRESPIADNDDREHIFDGLRKAGLPE